MGPIGRIGPMTQRQGGGIIQAAQSTVPLRSWEFRLRTVEDLRNLSHRLGVNVEAVEDVSILAQPVAFDGLTIPNSLSVHAMEGCDGDAEAARAG